ncbi:MAG: translation initiation factor IF-2 [Proteobacteria bacterium]|nr:translation initiation factor IF-2 [Pseudomonadota bacterium]
MKKIRVYELARQLDMESRVLVDKIKAMGIFISNYQSALSESQCQSIKEKLAAAEKNPAGKKTVIIRRRKKAVPETTAKTATEDTSSAANLETEHGLAADNTVDNAANNTITAESSNNLEDHESSSHSQAPENLDILDTTTNKSDTDTQEESRADDAATATLTSASELSSELSSELAHQRAHQRAHQQAHQQADQRASTTQDVDNASDQNSVSQPDGKDSDDESTRFSKVALTLAQKRSKQSSDLQAPLPSARIIQKSSHVTTPATPATNNNKENEEGQTATTAKPATDDKRRDKRGVAYESDALKPKNLQKKERRANYNARLLLSKIDDDEPFVAPTRRKTVYSPAGGRGRDHKRRRDLKKTQITTPKASLRVIHMTDTTMSVGELARQLSMKASELIKHLMKEGIMATVNQHLDSDSIEILASNFGFEVKAKYKTVEELLSRRKPAEDSYYIRPPIVTLMGHVDHGKTSILDAIRSSAISADESGGITQHIGAYRVTHNDKSITFLDTPGHAAFSNMRLRGAKVTDIVILVVAADDGVMPQTEEAISHAKDADVSVIVALSKIDKPNHNLDRIYTELAEKGIQSEEWGGDHQFVKVSALQKTGLVDLLEAILLQAELMELKVSDDIEARGVIIESHLDKGRGPIATIMVSEGVFRVGDMVVAGTASGRIRSMANDQGKKVAKATPSMPVEIVGLNELPMVGDMVDAVKDHETAKSVISQRNTELAKKQLGSATLTSLEDLVAKVESDKILALPCIIKADTQGSLQAICESLTDIKSEKIKAQIVHSGVGGINDSDISLAQTSGSVIFGFNVRTTSNSLTFAENSRVVIQYFSIIYDLIDAARNLMLGSLPPVQNEVVIGRADVRKPISVPKIGLVAGSAVMDGKITRHCMLRLIRDDVVVYTGKIGSLRRFKDDVKEVGSGYECGISFENYNDIREGDILEAFKIEELQATL